MLDQHAARQRDILADASTGATAYGHVIATPATGRVTVELDDEPGRSYGAPDGIPYQPHTDTPAAGWRAFLHYDVDGQPAYAAVWAP